VGDLAGRKRIFIIGLLGFAVASAVGGLAPSAGVLFAARALQGVFAALLAPAALSLVSVTAGSVALVYGVTLAGEGSGWLSPGPLSLFIAAAVLLGVFLAVERHSASPLLPLRVVTDRVRGGSFITSASISAGMFAMFLLLAYYLQLDLGLSPLLAGLAILPFSAGIVATATAAARLLPRYGPRPLMVGGMVAGTLGMGWLALLTATSGYWLGVFPAMLIMGIGLGFVFVPLSSVALTGVDPSDAGVASALLNATQQVGGAVGVALLNTLYTASLARSAAAGTAPLEAHTAGYRLAFAVATGLFSVALVVITVTTRVRRTGRPTPQVSVG